MKEKINGFIFFISLLILYTIYSPLIVFALQNIGFDITKYDLHTKNIFLILIDITLMIIIYFIFRKDNNYEISHYFKKIKKYFFFGFKMWILGLLLMISSNIIIHYLYPAAVATNEEAVQSMLRSSPVYAAFAAAVFAPFTEEMIFRKSLKYVFDNNFIYILCSGFLFGFAHNLSNIGSLQMIYIIPYGLFGCIFAYTYVKTRNIFVPITFHFIHNTVLVLLSFITMGVIK